MLEKQGKKTEAANNYREALAIQRASRDNRREFAYSLVKFVRFLREQGLLAEAEALSRETISLFDELIQNGATDIYLRQEQAFNHRVLGELLASA